MADDQEPKSHYMRGIFLDGLSGVRPLATAYSDLEKEAYKKLPVEAYNYVAGGASVQGTMVANRTAFERWQIVPRMLASVDISRFSTSAHFLGRHFPTPLIIAPIGVQGQLHPDADIATARAASELGIPFTLSSATSRPMEMVAQHGGERHEEGGGEKWFQLYWPADDEVTESLISRAKKAGYKVLVVTLDTWSLGWRPKDLDTGYNPFLRGEGVANLFTDPVFVRKYCDGKSPRDPTATRDDIFSAAIQAVQLLTPGNSRGWHELDLLRKFWGEGDIILKGIQCVEDAARAVERGVQGVWISNHGGRQVDGAIASLQTLPAIASYLRSVPSEPAIIFDSGIRTGADIMKALALGAHAVGIGRPYAWGLSIDGEQGVSHVLKSLLADLELNAALAGCQDTRSLGWHTVLREGERL